MKWITRERARVDRIACPWLIARFIDPMPRVPVRAGGPGAGGGQARGRDPVRRPERRAGASRARSARSTRSSSDSSWAIRRSAKLAPHRAGRRHRRPRAHAGVRRALRRGDRLPGQQPRRLRQHGAPVSDVRRALRLLRTRTRGARRGPRVLFVCLHGAAKSVVGAAHFRRLAAARGLAIDAVAAGTEPDPELAPGAVKGLAGDGPRGRAEPPAAGDALRPGSAPRASSSFGCELTPTRGQRVDQWDVPAVSDGYAAARDRIVASVERLVAELGGGR